MKNLYAGLAGVVSSKRSLLELSVMFICPVIFLLVHLKTRVPKASTQAIIIPTIKEDFLSIAPLMAMWGMFMLVWFLYCRRLYPSKHHQIAPSEGANLEEQRHLTQLNLAKACSGTKADHVWFSGMLAALGGTATSAVLYFMRVFPI